MEKGPQDALTLDARYSLSEEKLLRSTFEYKELTVFVSSSDSVYAQSDIPVRVLDCDTITQVKEKCLDVKYRGYRFADRPGANDLELEWKTGLNGKMALQDIDSSSRTEGGNWKRLNTLAHYNVPNGAILTLTSKSNSLYNLVNFSQGSVKTTTAVTFFCINSLLSIREESKCAPQNLVLRGIHFRRRIISFPVEFT
uniref:Plexin_cytopl domain-containing protein n=2 Tax=Caenorhabditis japonica TaxID=281687 RepID=A0A8R1IFB4_CAEJA